jgi:predicted MFS family arabinose efflux permease
LGGVIPIISAVLANTIKAGDEGLAFGLDNSVNAAGRGLAPLLGAAVATAWGYPFTFVVTGLMFVISTALGLWRLPQTNQRL